MKTGRVVVVTGGGGGMGSLFVGRFLGNGDSVFAADVSADALARLRASLSDEGRLCTVITDISDEASCDSLAETVRERAGRVDVLVNCAGYFPITPFESLTAAEWRKVVDINLTGTFLMIRAMHPLMKGRGWGRVVNIGSASTFEGVAEQAPYVSAKAGIFGLSRSLARALGKDGITVNVITPGLTVTPPVRESMPSDFLQEEVNARVLRREERPDDLVGAVFFLASPDADFITGQTINVDGGKHML